MQKNFLRIHNDDNLVVALRDMDKGTILKEYSLELREKIPAKHKLTLHDIPTGGMLRMYGVIVGRATSPIGKGHLITSHNIRHATANYQISESRIDWTPPDISTFKNDCFMGYHRKDGQVGTRNYWLVVPLVFCENRNVRLMQEHMLEKLGYHTGHPFEINMDKLVAIHQEGKGPLEIDKASIVISQSDKTRNRPFRNVDGIKFLEHTGGCGGTRDDSHTLCKLIAGYINNPNVAGATILSLGCQMSQIKDLQTALENINQDYQKPVIFTEHQKAGTDTAYIENAIKQTFKGLMEADKVDRQPASLNKLCIGLECGGSDGFSGISANPTLGYVSDMIVSLGGAAILSEFPELHGVEQELINRCLSREKAQKFTTLMSAYSEKAKMHGTDFSMNPSPGNIRDGLITDAIKSAGAAKKGGTSPIVDVLDYTEQVRGSGLYLLCTPGNDVESTTGLAGSGANIILFSTGLGTPTGNPVAPVIKISTNSQLARRMPSIIDFDTGDIIDGKAGIKDKGRELLRYIIEVANGTIEPRAVQNRQDDFIPWKRGISL